MVPSSAQPWQLSGDAPDTLLFGQTYSAGFLVPTAKIPLVQCTSVFHLHPMTLLTIDHMTAEPHRARACLSFGAHGG